MTGRFAGLDPSERPLSPHPQVEVSLIGRARIQFRVPVSSYLRSAVRPLFVHRRFDLPADTKPAAGPGERIRFVTPLLRVESNGVSGFQTVEEQEKS